jgi:hypothetical protein
VVVDNPCHVPDHAFDNGTAATAACWVLPNGDHARLSMPLAKKIAAHKVIFKLDRLFLLYPHYISGKLSVQWHDEAAGFRCSAP